MSLDPLLSLYNSLLPSVRVKMLITGCLFSQQIRKPLDPSNTKATSCHIRVRVFSQNAGHLPGGGEVLNRRLRREVQPGHSNPDPV